MNELVTFSCLNLSGTNARQKKSKLVVLVAIIDREQWNAKGLTAREYGDGRLDKTSSGRSQSCRQTTLCARCSILKTRQSSGCIQTSCVEDSLLLGRSTSGQGSCSEGA